jgi:hypothetical protein
MLANLKINKIFDWKKSTGRDGLKRSIKEAQAPVEL